MTKYLIDTNICIYIMNKRPIEIIHKFKQFDIGDIGVSTITISELQYGIVKSKNRALNTNRVEEFLAPLEIIPYDEIASKIYGDIRYKLEKRGQIIGPLDLLIAAQALSRGLVLITNNEKEFKRVINLEVENWAK
ncbi:MAG: type II toxin-antitoxin system VapC family toxin [Proteobacteria bacterium]|nr:type II toxin-antitoxin system VapC family toxin [Pseudomonadota bacterium]MBU4472383.1 type II toxin-antitoxin system VapC family toxin [Pseudomonadota bacterium]MCG2752079.1 type II toxin-antitoxin system VapC family toxin [Desulfobacteraceae bacterium]